MPRAAIIECEGITAIMTSTHVKGWAKLSHVAPSTDTNLPTKPRQFVIDSLLSLNRTLYEYECIREMFHYIIASTDLHLNYLCNVIVIHLQIYFTQSMYLLCISMWVFMIPGAMSIIPALRCPAWIIVSFENTVMIFTIAVRLAWCPVDVLSHLMGLIPHISTCKTVNMLCYIVRWEENKLIPSVG